MIYDVKVRPDVVIRVQAENEDEATKKAFVELEKTESSKIFDDSFFDYEKGLKNIKVRSLIGIAEGRDQAGREIEKENVLKKYVGSDGFIYDSKGNLALTPNGQRSLYEQDLYDEADLTDKNVVIDERGFSTGDFADLAGIAGPIFGAIAAMSPHVRGVKLLQMLVRNKRIANMFASGIGTAGGKAAEEAYETSKGLQTQTEEEQNKMLRNEFYFGFGAQGIGEAAGLAYGAFFGAKAPASAMRDGWVVANGYAMDDVLILDAKLGKQATEKQITKAVKNGEIMQLDAKGSVSQQFLGRAIPGRMQGIGETIAGKAGREQGLIDYNMSMLAKLQQKLTDKEIALKRVSEVGDLNLASVEVKAAREGLEKTKNEVSDYLNKVMLDLSSETGGFGPIMQAMSKTELGSSVQNTIKQAYKDVIKHHQKVYEGIDGRIMKLEASAPEGLVMSPTKGTLWPVDSPQGRMIANLSNPKSSISSQLEASMGGDLIKVANFIDDTLKVKNPLLKYNEDDVGLNIIQGLAKEIKQGGAYANGATITQLRAIEEALKGVKSVQGLKSRGQAGHFYDDVEKMITEIIETAPDKLRIITAKKNFNLSQAQKNEVESVIKALRAEQNSYRAAIEPFNNARVQKIKTQAQGQGVDPLDVYEYVVKANKGGDLKAILNALKRGPTGGVSKDGKFIAAQSGEEASNHLRAELTRRLFKDAVETATDPVTGIFSPEKYAGNILKYKQSLEPLLGNNYDKMMRTLKQVSKYDPKLKGDEILKAANSIRSSNINGLAPSFNKFLDTLESQAKASGDLLNFQKSTFMRNVENATPETIVQTIFRPNSAREINQLKGLISNEAFLNVQEEALGKLITKSMPGGKELTEIFKPNVLERAIQSYGPETLEAMFGKELVMSLTGFSRAMSTTVAGAQKTGAGSIVAGTLAAGFFNVNLLPTVVLLTVYKTLFAQPKIVSLLSKTDKGSIAQVMSAFSKALRIAGVTEVMGGAEEFGEEVLREVNKTGIVDQARQQLPTNQQFQGLIDQLPTRPSNLNLNIPDIQPIANAPTQAPMSRSLLGGSIANEDIAARMNANRGGLVSKRSAIDQEIAELMARA